LPLIKNLRNYPFDGYSCDNGADCYIDGKLVFSDPIDPEDARTIARITDENHLSVVSFPQSGMYLNFANEEFLKVKALLHIPDLPFRPTFESTKEPVYEFTIYMTKEEEDRLLAPHLKNVTFPRWNVGFADAISADASKGTSMIRLLEFFGLKPEEAIAFGDGGNDIPMIKAAGIGVAMGNATDIVKAEADYVADTVDNHGVISTLEHFGLI
jgi:Cof subfamily protein (haloacid dehalogenase superfamily)